MTNEQLAGPDLFVANQPGANNQQLSNNAISSPSPQQLAIYINGKIRSNSIFCRSTSSNSFTSILKSFHHKEPQGHSVDQDQRPRGASGGTHHHQARSSSGASVAGSASEHANSNSHRQLLFDPENQAKNSGNFTKRRLGSSSRAKSVIGRFLLPAGGHLLGRCLKQKQTDTGRAPESKTPSDDNGLRKAPGADLKAAQQQQADQLDDTEEEQKQTASSYKLNPSSMFLRKAMRYYRLWIYSANLTILLGTLIFVLSTIYVTSDARIKLLISSSSSSPEVTASGDSSSSSSRKLWQKSWPANDRHAVLPGDTTAGASQQDDGSRRHQTNNNRTDSDPAPGTGPGSSGSTYEHEQAKLHEFGVSLNEPAIILAYVAIAVQMGLLQAIGCFGAIRMKEKWIQAFWYLISVLTLFDVVFLIYWLQRYDLMVKSLRHEMTFRLTRQYGHSSVIFDYIDEQGADQTMAANNNNSNNNNNNSTSTQVDRELDWPLGPKTNFDKIFTEILDKIQNESQCCGISSSLDFKQSAWRQKKLKQLDSKLSGGLTTKRATTEALATSNEVRSLLRRVPLVPASCCRPRPPPVATFEQHQETNKRRDGKSVILDDSQLITRPRVPAWAPSMVVDDLLLGSSNHHHQQPQPGDELSARGPSDLGEQATRPTLADVIDKRWNGWHQEEVGDMSRRGSEPEPEPESEPEPEPEPESESESEAGAGAGRQLRRRLLAKQVHYGHQHENNDDDKIIMANNEPRRQKLNGPPSIEPPDAEWSEPALATDGGRLMDAKRRKRWAVESTVDEGQRVLSRFIESIDDEKPSSPCDVNKSDSSQSLGATSGRTRAQQLGWQLEEMRQILFANDDSNNNNNGSDNSFPESRFRWPNRLHLNYDQYKVVEGYLLAELLDYHENGRTPDLPLVGPKVRRSISVAAGGQPSGSEDQENNRQEFKERLRFKLVETLHQDPEISCAPRSYFDQARIYTRGCQPFIKAWLDSSANVLFVMGFCVLTVLKFCSLILLRLEIREMIHKIRVLKGMATEYNALHDLEAYLPRPSVCAQAAELTSSGVAPALAAQPASIGPGACSSAGSSAAQFAAPPRLGGSFSEAVAAATAAAHQYQAGARAASMKTIPLTIGDAAQTALASGATLMPTDVSLYPRSSSASAAHLHGAALAALQKSAPQQACSLRSDLFPAAGSISMPRRHTAVSVCPAAAAAAAAAAHLMFRRGTYAVPSPPSYGAAGASFAAPVNGPLGHASLAQHRHSSAHTVALAASNTNLARCNLSAIATRPPRATSGRPSAATPADEFGGNRLLPLVGSHPFKRQSSGGAQSAVNFSLDISPAQLAESRRSIH